MQKTLDAIHNLNIVDVIQKYIPLKKKGADYKACCPFHDEKTSSFSVKASEGYYKCFGCGVGGDAIKFVREHQHLDFLDAVEEICKTHGIPFEKKALSEEEKQVISARESIIKVNEVAKAFFIDNLKKNTGKEMLYAQGRFTDEMIEQFEIGIAPSGWTGFLDHAKSKHILLDPILISTLVRKADKSEKFFDFFRERLMFPIHDERGNTIGFTGRLFEEQKGQPKYMNSIDTAAYQKKRVLYGLFQAKQHIVKKGFAIITEGQADTVSLHQNNIKNTVAGSGTAFDPAQLNTLKKYTNELLFIYDNDIAGNKAWVKNGKLAVQMGFSVSVLVLPEGKDPDSFFESEDHFNEYTEANKQEYIIKFAEQFFKQGASTPAKAKAINDIALLLHSMEEETRSIYIEMLNGIVKPLKALKDKLKMILTDSGKDKADVGDDDDAEDFGYLPRGVDPKEYIKYSFYEDKNSYYFRVKGSHVQCSNFIMNPLFHIKSTNDSRRLYEIINIYGHKEVIDIEQAGMISLQMYRKSVESKGNYLWMGNDLQFMKLKMKLYDKTKTCKLIEHLGWQKAGFWAFANMIFDGKKSQNVDNNGIIEHKDEYYFIPALSDIYKADNDVYVSDRKFLHKPSSLKLNDWTNQFIKVYGDAARLAIPYLFSSLFRDIIYDRFKMFPILNLFGPPGTGKSQMARSLMYWFGEAQDPYNIHNGTKVGLSEHLAENSNALAWVDEYKNNIDYDKVEMLKSTYDGVGRKKGSIDRGAKSKTSAILQAILLGGQEMPTADVALLKRVILVSFKKDKFSDEEKKRYDHLKELEQQGLSHFVIELMQYREEMRTMYKDSFAEVFEDFDKELKDFAIEDRILRNTLALAATFKLLNKYLKLDFSYDDYFAVAVANIKEQSDFILNSREISAFWNIYAKLFEDGIILEGTDFKIVTVTEIKTNKGFKKFKDPKQLILIRMAKVYLAYAKEGKSSGENILPKATLDYYLKSSPDFLATKDRVRFKSNVTSSYIFDYQKLGIDLIKIIGPETDDIVAYNKNDKKPDPKQQKMEIPAVSK